MAADPTDPLAAMGLDKGELVSMALNQGSASKKKVK